MRERVRPLVRRYLFALGRKLEQAAAGDDDGAGLDREREERARAAVAVERERIARELHDVLGHSVSVMTVQSAAVRRLLRPEQDREREALLAVEKTGRRALTEMRRLVGVLQSPEEAPSRAPQPSLEHLDTLVEQLAATGLHVEVRVEGAPAPLPPGIDLTAYRVVQEGLASAQRCAEARNAEVLVRYGDDDLELFISDDGKAAATVDQRLLGMRERVAVYGGQLEVRPDGRQRYSVRARLPLT